MILIGQYDSPFVRRVAVALRLDRYQVALDADAGAYVAAVLAHPLMQRWCAEAAAEPESWRLEKYESM